MLLWIVSDLHLELTSGWDLPAADARPRFDVMVVAGDLLVHLDVGVPEKLDTRQTELLRELAALRGEEQPEYSGQARNGLFGRRKTAGRGR